MQPQIRPARLEDAAEVARYMAELLSEGLDTLAPRDPPTEAEEKAWIQEALARADALILLAVADDQVVGVLDLEADLRPHYRHGGRFGMSVARRWRRRGVGRRLLHAALQQARLWPGFCRVELEVTPWNVAAVRLYESSGFRLEGRRIKAVNLRGRPEDILVMSMTW